MYFSAMMRVETNDFTEYYYFDEDQYSIGDVDDFPPIDFQFKMSIVKDEYGSIDNRTTLSPFFFLQKICKNQLCEYMINDYMKHTRIDVWVL